MPRLGEFSGQGLKSKIFCFLRRYIKLLYIVEGTVILDETGERQIGHITSGIPSPSLKKNVAMGYVEAGFAKAGTNVKFDVRKRKIDAQVSKMPFVSTHYYTGK